MRTPAACIHLLRRTMGTRRVIPPSNPSGGANVPSTGHLTTAYALAMETVKSHAAVLAVVVGIVVLVGAYAMFLAPRVVTIYTDCANILHDGSGLQPTPLPSEMCADY